MLYGKSHSLHVDAYPQVWFTLSKSTCANFYEAFLRTLTLTLVLAV